VAQPKEPPITPTFLKKLIKAPATRKTTFSLPEDSTPRQTLGSHLWILQKQAGTWVITLMSRSFWDFRTDCGIRYEKRALARRLHSFLRSSIQVKNGSNNFLKGSRQQRPDRKSVG